MQINSRRTDGRVWVMTYALNSPPPARVESIFSTISVRPPDAAPDMASAVDIAAREEGGREEVGSR